MAFTGSYSITVDHAKCGSTDTANYTVLIYGTYSYLKTTANGGQVTSSNGYDINFFSNSGLTTKLTWEVVNYSPTTGAVEIWVQIANLSHTADTVFYMGVGDSSITTFQGGSTGAAWDSHYSGVFHFPNGTTLSLSDSTTNGNGLTGTNSPTATTGIIDGGVNFTNASSQYASVAADLGQGSGALTLEGWVKPTSFPNAYNTFLGLDGTVPFFDIHLKSNGKLAVYISPANVAIFYDGTGVNTLSSGTWYRIFATYDSTSGLICRVNGSVDGTASAGSTAPINFTIFQISNNLPGFNGRYIDGAVDEVRVSTVARSADYDTANYNNQASPSTFYTISSLGGGSVATIGLALGVNGVGAALSPLAGTNPIQIGVSGSGAALFSSAGGVPIQIGVSGAGSSTSGGQGAGTIGLNIGVSGATAYAQAATGTVPIQINVNGAGQTVQTISAAGTIGLNIGLSGVGPSTSFGFGDNFLPLTERQIRALKKRNRKRRKLEEELIEAQRVEDAGLIAQIRTKLIPLTEPEKPSVNNISDDVEDDEDDLFILLHG